MRSMGSMLDIPLLRVTRDRAGVPKPEGVDAAGYTWAAVVVWGSMARAAAANRRSGSPSKDPCPGTHVASYR